MALDDQDSGITGGGGGFMPINQSSSNTIAPEIVGGENEATIKMVKRLFEKDNADRESLSGEWKKQEEFYYGKQWDSKRPKYKASPVLNIIRPTVQTIVPIMTDTEPGFDFSPKDPSDWAFSETMSELMLNWWSRQSMNETIVELIMDSCLLDVGILKVIWDNELEEGIGDVKCAVISPYDIFVPKNSYDFNDNCSHVIHRMWKPVGELKRKFPDKAEDIVSTGKSKESKDDGYTGDITPVSPINKKSTAYVTPADNGAGDSDMVEVWECWMDDYSIEEYELEEGESEVSENEEEKDAGKKVEEDLDKMMAPEQKMGKKYKYPSGRVIKILPGNNVVLEDKPNPYKDGKKPFVRVINTLKPRSFYGEGEVAPLMETQRIINKTAGSIIDYMNMTGNPVWVKDANSGVQNHQLTNQVGLIITKNPGSVCQREAPPPMPSYYFDLYNAMQSFSAQVSGAHDVTQGRRPTGVTAAEAISELQEAAQTRIRLKERNLQVALTQLGYMWASRVLQYYREPRVVKITGKSGKWPEFFEMRLEDVPGNESTIDRVRYIKTGYKYSESAGKYVAGLPENGTPSKGLFDISVVAGTSLPYQKEKRGSLARSLFKDNAIDQKNLLETLEWPKAEEVLARMEREAAAAPPTM